MIRSTPFFIGCRYMLARKGSRVLSFTALMSMAGLVLGVFALILVLSVFNGSQGIQRERTLITVPHGDISASGEIADWQSVQSAAGKHAGVIGIAPYLQTQAMISERGFHKVAQIKGIDPDAESLVSTVPDHLIQGSLGDLTPGSHQMLLASSLAASLRLDTGDTLNVVLPVVSANGQGFTLEIHRFTVAGLFDVHFSVGSDLAYIHLADAAEIMRLDSADEALHLRLKLADVHAAREVMEEIGQTLELDFPQYEFTVSDWSRSEASLFNALRMEKILTGFMLMMIVAIGAFNIVSTLVMVVSDKQADIAILRTMGAGERTIMGIFLVQGCLSGVVGIAGGALAGIVLSLNFSLVSGLVNTVFAPSDMYIIASLPAELQWPDVYVVCSSALVISFLATLYPSWKASRIQPAEVLRYE